MQGSGTQSNPFLISSSSDLQAINSNLSSYYELANDIDMIGFNFTPIGRTYPFFSGHLDGKGYKISNLRVVSTIEYAGLIARTNGGSIKNLGLENVYIQSNSDSVGGLIGLNSLSDYISNCYVTGTIKQTNTSKSYVGGLIGRNFGNVSNCYTDCEVSGGNSVGGFCGLINYANSVISNCYSVSRVNGSQKVGGFLGENGSGVIYQNCYYDSSQTTTTVVGGIEGKSLSELKNQATYKNWDFKNEWYIADEYPQLRVFGVPLELHKEIIELVSSANTITSRVNTLKIKDIQTNSCVNSFYSHVEARRSVLRILGSYLSSIHSNVTQSHLRVNRAIRESNSYLNNIFTMVNVYSPSNDKPVFAKSLVNTNNSKLVMNSNKSITHCIINPSQSEVT